MSGVDDGAGAVTGKAKPSSAEACFERQRRLEQKALVRDNLSKEGLPGSPQEAGHINGIEGVGKQLLLYGANVVTSCYPVDG